MEQAANDGQLASFRNSLARASRVLLDTNAVIYFLQGVPGYLPLVETLFSEVESGRLRAGISVISELELLAKPMRELREDAVENIRLFLGGFPNLDVIDVDRRIAREAARIRATKGLAVVDSIVVATSVVAGFDHIIGNDVECFKKVSEPPYILLGDFLAPSQPSEGNGVPSLH